MTQPSKSTHQPKVEAKDKANDLTNKDKPSSSGKSAREIEAEIGQTRSAIVGDIRELEDKFSSENIKASAKDVMGGVKDAAVEQATEIKNAVVDKVGDVKDAVVEKAVEVKDAAADKMIEAKDAMLDRMEDVGEQARRAGTATWQFTRSNAVPLALLGAGVTWLIANNRTNKRRYEPARAYRPEYAGDPWIDDGVETVERSPRRTATESGLRPAQLYNGGGQRKTADKASGRISARAHDLKQEAGERLERAEHAIASGAARGMEYVQTTARRAGTATQEFAEANPMLLAAAALAAGIGVGMLLPSTEREDQLLAPARQKFQRLVGEVQDAATDLAEVAKDTASESMNALA